MIEKGISPDLVSYNILINGFQLRNYSNEALALYKKMREMGVKPDELTFRFLIDGFLRDGKAKKAYEIWEHMMDKGRDPGRSKLKTCRSCEI
jgi:pentatricopeptide repeat protein